VLQWSSFDEPDELLSTIQNGWSDCENVSMEIVNMLNDVEIEMSNSVLRTVDLEMRCCDGTPRKNIRSFSFRQKDLCGDRRKSISANLAFHAIDDSFKSVRRGAHRLVDAKRRSSSDTDER
jgi:hypothetical protein